MPDTYNEIESRIANAIHELGKYENLNIAAVAWQYPIPAKRLINWCRGHKSKIEYEGYDKALFEAQALGLYQYLDNLDRGGPKARYKQLEQATNALLNEKYIKGGKPPTVKAHWARFLQRHPQLVVQKQKPLATERKNVHKPETFQTHFKNYCVAKTEKGIHNEAIYNFEETGFRAEVKKD